MIAFIIGLTLGWLTAAVVIALRDCWPAPGEEPLDADTEESAW